MKSFFLTMVFALASLTVSYSQKIAVVDIAYILDNMDAYKKAQEELDNTAKVWQQEISVEHDKIKSMYNKYQAEIVLLSDDMKRQKEEEIMAKENEVRELQRIKFGPEGELFQKRQSLVAPVQDQVYATIQDYATERGYDIILDKAGNAGVIFSNERYDKTDDVLRLIKN
ncbi:MAG: OmpH family outer membrane protein [Saprospiraceae bacterium]|nr:OmpH family outer membrane protein [Saprospiraceae bacterium]